MKTGHESTPVDVVDRSADPVQATISNEEHQLVWNALEKMPEKYREVVALYYRQGQSVAQVAESTGISEEAARWRIVYWRFRER